MNRPLQEANLLSVRQFAAIFRARTGQIVLTVALIFLLTLVIVMVTPRVWTATADVFIDYKDDTGSGQGFSPMLNDSYIQTQMDMIRSQAVAEHVIDSLGLRNSQGSGEEGLNEWIRRQIQIDSVRGSRVLSVSFDARSPQDARDYANAVVNSYIAVSQQLASTATRARSEQYQAQLDQLRAEIDGIQDKLTQYQQDTGTLDGQDTGNSLENRRLNEMNTALLGIQTRLAEARARNDARERALAAGTRVEDLPEVGQVIAVNDLKDAINLQDRRLGEIRGTLGPNHPTMRGMQAERGDLAGRLTRAANAALQNLRAETERLAAQEQALTADMQAQRARVLEQMRQRDQVAAYQRQLESVQQVYRTALQRYDSVAGNINVSNASVLRAAEVPASPSRPRVLRSLVLSLVVGLFIGLALALALELLNRRVRCPEDLQGAHRLPLLGTIGLAAPARRAA